MNNIEFLNTFFENKISELNISLPATIVSYDFKTKKASVQPLLSVKYNDGEIIDMPIINNVPVVHPSTFKASIILPVSVGDFVHLIFCQKSLEEWLKNGKKVAPDDPRQFDLSDAIAYLGLSPFSNSNPATSADDLLIQCNNSSITMKPSSVVDIKATTINIQADNVNVSGKLSAQNIEASSNLKGATATIGSKDFATHTHGGVVSGPSITGVVS